CRQPSIYICYHLSLAESCPLRAGSAGPMASDVSGGSLVRAVLLARVTGSPGRMCEAPARAGRGPHTVLDGRSAAGGRSGWVRGGQRALVQLAGQAVDQVLQGLPGAGWPDPVRQLGRGEADVHLRVAFRELEGDEVERRKPFAARRDPGAWFGVHHGSSSCVLRGAAGRAGQLLA